MGQTRRKREGRNDSIHVDGREFPVLDRLHVHRRTYLVLEEVGNLGRQRFMAFDPHVRELRAVSVLPRSHTAEQQLRVMKRLRNDNFPRIFDYSVESDRIVLVLDWIRGPTVQEQLDAVRRRDRPRPSAYKAFELYRGLAHGLAWMYKRRQVIHGDIKPHNIVISNDQSRLIPIDFGSAWLAERTAVREPGDGAHAAYSAPELQVDQNFTNFRADLFSASVVFYELLTLKVPYDHWGGKAGRPEFIEKFQDTLTPPSKLLPRRNRIPRAILNGIDRIAANSLALAPDNRYATISAWLDDVDAVYLEMKRLPKTSQLSRVESLLTRFVGWFSTSRRD